MLRRVGSCAFARFADALTNGSQLKVDLALDQGGDNPMNIPEALYRKNAAAADAATEASSGQPSP